MNAKRLLIVLILLTVALTLGLSAAAAQDAPPAKGQPRGEGTIREETALGPNQALPPVWESENNDSFGDADWVHDTGVFATHLSGTFGAPGDVDYYEFYGIAGDQLIVTTAAERYGSAADTVITLYDEAGNTLASNDDYEDYLWGTVDSRLSYTLISEQFYYLKVANFFADRGGPSYWYDVFVSMPVRDSEWWYQYGPGDDEPNNTRATAYGLRYGTTLPWTRMDNAGDVDYFKFDGMAGDQVRIRVETTGIFGTLRSVVGLYNSAGTLLGSCRPDPNGWPPDSSNCFVQKTLPKTATYYVKVSDAGNAPSGQYWLQIGFLEPAEPNDGLAQATPLNYGQKVRGLVSTGDTCDTYRFYGQAGDYVTLLGPGDGVMVELDNAAGDYLTSNFERFGLPMSYALPANDWYYASVCGYYFLDYTPYHFGAYELAVDKMVLAGMKANGLAGGLAFSKGDILAWLPGSNQAAMFFDGSDVGLPPTANVMDFDVVQESYEGGADPEYLLMSFKTPTLLPDYPAPFKAMAQDVIKFAPWELGDSTDGNWEMYLDGSDIGLTTTAEFIDAVDLIVSEYDELFLSTVGRATVVPNNGSAPFTAEDEDLFHCGAPPGGWNTVVNCRLYFDGSAAGIPATADITAVWLDPEAPNWDIHMTFAAATIVNGVTYQPNDVAVCRPNSMVMPITSCTWLPKPWMGNTRGMSGKVIDGLTFHLEQPYW